MDMKKKKIGFLLAITAILFISLFLLANAAFTTSDAWHPLEQIAKTDSASTSVDADGDGVIDEAEGLNNPSGDAIANSNLDMDGNDIVNAGGFFYSSDKRLKTNIKTLNNPVERLSNVRGVSFDWKDDGKESLGLIAQNVETEFPELVRTNPKSGMKSVQYGNMVAVLTEAVKEQQKEIDNLEQELDQLKKEVEELKEK